MHIYHCLHLNERTSPSLEPEPKAQPFNTIFDSTLVIQHRDEELELKITLRKLAESIEPDADET